MSLPEQVALPAPSVEGLMSLVEALCFEAGKTAIAVAEGVPRGSAEHASLERKFTSAESSIRAYAESLAAPQPQQEQPSVHLAADDRTVPSAVSELSPCPVTGAAPTQQEASLIELGAEIMEQMKVMGLLSGNGPSMTVAQWDAIFAVVRHFAAHGIGSPSAVMGDGQHG